MALMSAPAPPPALMLMTVTGPLEPTAALAAGGPVLCREWLLNDQCALLERGSGNADSVEATAAPTEVGACMGDSRRPRSDDCVEMGTLTAMRRWPLDALNNLHLLLGDVMNELGGPFKRQHPGALVVVCTPRAHWTPSAPWDRAESLRALSQETGVRIIAGTVPAPGCPASLNDFETEVARLMSDLAAGYEPNPSSKKQSSLTSEDDERVRPGLIGEFPLSDSMPASELLALRVCIEAHRRSEAPLFLSGPVSAEAFSVLEGASGSPGSGPCLWSRCAFFDVPPNSAVSAVELAARGAFVGFCPPPGAADVAWQPYPSRRPWKTEEAFLAALAAAPVGQVVIGSGLRFRTDLVAFGGPGLAYAPDLLVAAAAGYVGAPPSSLPGQDALRASAVALLQYPWQPPVPPEKVIYTIACHWCGTRKNEGEHFSKLGFDYCTPKCISKHRQVDFAPEMHDRKAA